MTESELELAGVPLLAVSDGPPELAARRGGTVVVVHGLRGHKGVQVPELRRLAGAGFLALGIDAAGHGARRWPDFDERFGASAERAARAFADVVTRTTADVTAIVDAVLARGWGEPGRIGIAGISLGGFVGYGAAVRERRLGAVVAMIGSPCWPWDARDSPHLLPERFFPVPLLSVVAGRDEVVPPGPARALHATLGPRYGVAPERLRIAEWPGSGHEMSPEDWDAAWREAVAWLARFLRHERGLAQERG